MAYDDDMAAELDDAVDEVNRLRVRLTFERKQARAEVDRLTAERDEARRDRDTLVGRQRRERDR